MKKNLKGRGDVAILGIFSFNYIFVIVTLFPLNAVVSPCFHCKILVPVYRVYTSCFHNTVVSSCYRLHISCLYHPGVTSCFSFYMIRLGANFTMREVASTASGYANCHYDIYQDAFSA